MPVDVAELQETGDAGVRLVIRDDRIQLVRVRSEQLAERTGLDIGGFEDHAVEIEHQDVWHDGHQAASAPVAFSA